MEKKGRAINNNFLKTRFIGSPVHPMGRAEKLRLAWPTLTGRRLRLVASTRIPHHPSRTTHANQGKSRQMQALYSKNVRGKGVIEVATALADALALAT
jgi:hypothetical protein